jgi:pyruvate dehydrogenase E1 component alpha subunit
MDKAVQNARAGNGPTLLEMETYRYKGHSMSDPAKYRTKEEVEAYKAKDPVEIVKAKILDSKFATEDDIKAINDRINKVVEDSVTFAENSPYPDASELYKDVYEDEHYPYLMN